MRSGSTYLASSCWPKGEEAERSAAAAGADGAAAPAPIPLRVLTPRDTASAASPARAKARGVRVIGLPFTRLIAVDEPVQEPRPRIGIEVVLARPGTTEQFRMGVDPHR